MMKIFAKHGTNEKVIVPCPQESIPTVLKRLDEIQGGHWLWVDKIQPGEGLLFTDNLIYEGYTPGIPRYSSNIIKL